MQELRRHWKRILLYGLAGVTLLIVIVQLLYPADQLLPYARIDGVPVGGWQKADATWELDHRYLTKRVGIYFAANETPYRAPVTGEVGIVVKNHSRIDHITYPWWLRLLPTSIMWAHTVSRVPAPDYETNEQALDVYMKKELGGSCSVAPKEASLKYTEAKLQVSNAEPGGTCQLQNIRSALQTTRPTLAANASVRIPMQVIVPKVTTVVAQNLATSLTRRIGAGVSMKAGTASVVIPADRVMSWLDFTVDNGTLAPHLNRERAIGYLTDTIAPKVTVPAGVTHVTTVDFVETARQDGLEGQTLDVDNTLSDILSFLIEERSEAVAVASLTSPRIEYSRSYSQTDAGFSALLANFAKDHPGTFGISFIELSGKHRRATFNESNTFVTASTYKLFVAYGVLKRVDAGTWSWEDANISSGRNLATCFDDMIVKSDNACAESLLKKIGYKTITDEVKVLGLTQTSFTSGDTPHSSAGDEALFLAQLESNQLPLSAGSRDRLMGAMKRNIYRQGIPAGASGQVANKVGFLWGLLHDASIVYSPSGTYVLVIMTDGSSWRTIADLTRAIESLRSS
jgi:beta-lactamase class A